MKGHYFICDKCAKETKDASASLPSGWVQVEVIKSYGGEHQEYIWCSDCWRDVSSKKKV